MDNKLQQLISLLRGSGMQQGQQPPPPPQMGGMAGQAQGLIQARLQYNKYAADTMGQGQQPMPFEQFVQQMQGGQ